MIHLSTGRIVYQVTRVEVVSVVAVPRKALIESTYINVMIVT